MLPQQGADTRALQEIVLGGLGNHVDNAIRFVPGARHERVRTDISCTLFLADPDEYDGGELVIEDTCGEERVRLPAGDMVLYPGTSVHRVEPVTRGYRVASFFWVESMVRSDEQRRLLFEMDAHLIALRQQHGEGGLRSASPGPITISCGCGQIHECRSGIGTGRREAIAS